MLPPAAAAVPALGRVVLAVLGPDDAALSAPSGGGVRQALWLTLRQPKKIEKKAGFVRAVIEPSHFTAKTRPQVQPAPIAGARRTVACAGHTQRLNPKWHGARVPHEPRTAEILESYDELATLAPRATRTRRISRSRVARPHMAGPCRRNP